MRNANWLLREFSDMTPFVLRDKAVVHTRLGGKAEMLNVEENYLLCWPAVNSLPREPKGGDKSRS